MKSWDNPTEKMIQNSILYWLNYQPDILAFQVNTTGVFDPAKQVYRAPGKYVIRGTPDILACLDIAGVGVFIGLEVKSPKGSQTEHQKLFEARLTRKSGHYFIVRSIQDTERAIKAVRDLVFKRIKELSLTA